MKKYLPYLSFISVLCAVCLLFVGCADEGQNHKQEKLDSFVFYPGGEAENAGFQAPDEPEINWWEGLSDIEGVDLDLTMLSGTMVYSLVYNIMTYPDDYVGKVIKMSGSYSASFYDATDMYYHYLLIEDAMACCQSGLEFYWSGEHSYPVDYPADQAKIELVGVYESYDELGATYYRLRVDDIDVLS